jgi:hypothetical protein
MTFSDEELMVMFSAGTTVAFDMLYERYNGRIYRFARAFLGLLPGAVIRFWQWALLNPTSVA